MSGPVVSKEKRTSANGEMDNLTPGDIEARVFRMIKTEISNTFRPELKSEYATHVANMLCTVLDNLSLWRESPFSLKNHAEILESVTATGDKLGAPFRLEDNAGVANTLAEAVRKADTKELPYLSSLIANIELERIEFENKTTVKTNLEKQELLSKIEVEVTPRLLDAYFGKSTELTNEKTDCITRLPGGYSKDTFLVSCRSGREIVIRRDLPFGPADTTAPNEYRLLRQLAKFGLPVPNPIVAEKTFEPLGQPFLVVERIFGSNAAEIARKSKPLARDVALELARFLGRLHAIDPAEVSLSGTMADPQEEIRHYIDGWKQWWYRHRIHESPLIEIGFIWLSKNLPRNIDRLVTVHGDARPDNMLVDASGKLTAMLDWEHAHVGDAREDLEYAHEFVSGLIDRESFNEAYLDAGGVATGQGGRYFYEIWRSVRNLVCLEVAWGGFIRDRYPSYKIGAPILVFRNHLQTQLATSLQKINWVQ